MSGLVPDASVLVSALVDQGPEGRWAESVLATQPLASPQLALVETTNILRRLELAGRLSSIQADAARKDLLDLDLELFPFEPFAERVWELRHNLTSYDAWYVALAEAISAPLATLDLRLSDAPGPGCEFQTPPGS